MVFWLEIRTGVRIFFDNTPKNLWLRRVLAYPWELWQTCWCVSPLFGFRNMDYKTDWQRLSAKLKAIPKAIFWQ
jgi:hypothetical protein